ncbi:MAG: flavodoxin domain-containing protein [Roseitalea sp.]|jgi:MioC protein|nr:flavodoxin domain-containing protein [Roseitalea sp.]MBO6723324.1 flavodoxin domain-containing protein [Roseitalea sp.]MBO6741756.1 flavodoxin domain-containing protein [Roseitalea sp.]
MKIVILYGTETGNAEMLAEDIGDALDADHEVTCTNLSDFPVGEFDAETLYLVVCSTYGDGELPASAQPFAEVLKAGATSLAGVHFAIFGLGDSEYEETFNFGSKRLAELLTQHGAVQLGERATHDASGVDLAEDLALPWATEAVALAESRFGKAA